MGNLWRFRVSLFGVLLAVFCFGQEAMFVPSVKSSGDGKGGGLLELRFQVKPGSYLYEGELTLALSAGKATLKEGDRPVDYQGDLVFRKDFRRVYAVTGVPATPVKVTVGYQGCLDTGVCLMPETKTFEVSFGTGPAVSGMTSAAAAPAGTAGGGAKASDAAPSPASFDRLADGFEVIGTGAGYMSKNDFISWVDQVESGQGGASDDRDNVLFRVFHAYGLWLAMLLILPLGLMLNLTPCVLPMIPVNLAIIGAGAKDGRRGHGFVQGLAYGVGMAFSYGLLGVIVVLTGSQFGSLNASGWFNAGVAIVFVLLGLAMFDVFSIDLSRFRSGGLPGGQSKGKLAGAFLMGALSAVLAGACVAPVLIWVLVLSADLYSSGNVAGLVLPFMLGVGMALPWPILGAGLSKIPRPGMWMVRIRQLFGVLILGLALYYGYTGYRQFTGGASAEMAAGWTDDLLGGMASAQKAGRPVLIDFWGISCKNCHLMDKEVFPAQAVIDRLSGFEKVKFLADDQSDPLVSAAVRRYGVKGFPTFVVLRPKASR